MNLRHYAVVTGAYWALTVTDGALRMLVLLHFHELGYSPVTLGFLFLLYEFMGIVTNLVGGWMASRHGLNRTLHAGLATQVVALLLLSLVDAGWPVAASVAWTMGVQALSGVAKDLTKMSSKSAIKLIVGGETAAQHNSMLFKWVAILTGSKNALKGIGFFVGGALLAWIGFAQTLRSMAAVLAMTLITVVVLLRVDIGKSSTAKPFGATLSPSAAINRLSVARLFLFGARDIWFVVAFPIYLDEKLGWSFEGIGGFMAVWVIGYGVVQSVAPKLVRHGSGAEVRAARGWAFALAVVAAAIAVAQSAGFYPDIAVVGGLIIFGVVFAVNSSIHSFLILAYTEADNAVTDVGFYYSANATGRLIGTLLSGLAYLTGGLAAALWASAGFLLVTWLLSLKLHDQDPNSGSTDGTGSARTTA